MVCSRLLRTDAVPLLLVALALLLHPESAGASVSDPARGDQDHGPAGPGLGRGHGGASDGAAGTGTAHAVAEAAPRRAIGTDTGRSTLIAREREATAMAGPRTHNDATPCRLGRARAGATLQVRYRSCPRPSTAAARACWRAALKRDARASQPSLPTRGSCHPRLIGTP